MDRFVEQVFELVLRRPPDEDALASALERLESGKLSHAGLVAELVASVEFAQLHALDDAVAFATWARLVIEIPWVLSRYRGEARVLDVGSARAGLHIEEHELYGHDGEGWRSTDALDAGYGTTGAATSGVLCADLHPGGPLRGLSGF